ncbi:MAG: trypsin-like peptidase domain-containing protein [Candidatus Gastranaerophilales bacterium]|nr:trypsin-like peptidase domain-containing protein [Candidatus Gastranaerophilales bacterium]
MLSKINYLGRINYARKSLIVALFLFMPFTLNYSALSQTFSSDEQNNINVYDKTAPSIVSIDADVADGVSSGTGCVIDSRGIILTSSHVIENAKSIEISISNGKKYKAKLIAVMGENNDLAILKINSEKPLSVIKLGDSTKIKVGQKVLAIGNPFGFSRTLTTGIISRIDYKRNKIQTDAAINPGCSGGPLLNSAGEVVGISQSIYNPDNNKSNIGIGFAVPVNAAKRFIASEKKDIDILTVIPISK